MLPECEKYLLGVIVLRRRVRQESERITDDIVCRNDRTDRCGLRIVAREQDARRRKSGRGGSLDLAGGPCPVCIGPGGRIGSNAAIDEVAQTARINPRLRAGRNWGCRSVCNGIAV